MPRVRRQGKEILQALGSRIRKHDNIRRALHKRERDSSPTLLPQPPICYARFQRDGRVAQTDRAPDF